MTKWKTENGIQANTSLDGQSLTDLLEELGISKYYESRQCNTSSLPDFTLTSDGWRSCKDFFSVQCIYYCRFFFVSTNFHGSKKNGSFAAGDLMVLLKTA